MRRSRSENFGSLKIGIISWEKVQKCLLQHLDITLSFQAFRNLNYISSKVKLLSHEMFVAFALFFEAINMAPFSFEGVDGYSNSLIQNLKPSNKQEAVKREKFYRGEILKLSRNVSKIADLQAL